MQGMPKKPCLLKLFCLPLLILLLVSAQLIPISCASQNKESKSTPKQKNSSQEDTEKTPTRVDFPVQNSKVIVGQGIAERKTDEIEKIKKQEADEIARQVSQYYEIAFLQPDLWEEGKFSKLDSVFVSPLKERVREHLNDLSLGNEAKKIDSVYAVDAKVSDLWIALDQDLVPRLCEAKTVVEATYVQKDKGTADFKSSATFLLEPKTDTEWQIFDYDVSYEIRTEQE
jgi:hypothetical protein